QGGELRLDVRSDVQTRPRLERFARSSPNGVRVVGERGPCSFEQVQSEVRSRTGHELASARVRAGITRGHLLELVVYLAGSAGTSDVHADHAAELAVEGCLGERTVDDWVAGITSAPLPRSGPIRLLQHNDELARTFALSELPEAVERAVHGIQASLLDERLEAAAPRSDWVMLEVEAGDGRAVAQPDLLIASTFLPEMLKCFLEGAPFSSVRFARHGERFAYLKYESSGDLRARVAARQALEDELDARLRGGALGAVVGNGVGRRHCYVNLALSDVDRALGELTEVARHTGLPRESWILFCDTEWHFEWVGVWEHSPPPAA
ncbi:MAG TPA: hypothetical protein VFU02_01265, partial [Polyangiaceae bacterium]|nr:hypothetical protein [Polyangiaceae bacterium]